MARKKARRAKRSRHKKHPHKNYGKYLVAKRKLIKEYFG